MPKSAQAKIYLDYAAATAVADTVIEVMQPYLQDKFYNPSATYLAARQVRHELEASRAEVAATLGARPAEIVYTAGASEANNLAIRGIMELFPQGELLISAVEHASVIEPARLFNAKHTPVLSDGQVDLDALKQSINEHTVLVSVMLVNNELGTHQPFKEITDLVEKVRAERREAGNTMPLYVHTDAAQAANYIDLHVARLGVDLMSLNGGKIYGPKQTGCLYVKAGLELAPLIRGGGQERNMRSGTENIAGSIGFCSALTAAQKQHKLEYRRLAELKQRFISGLEVLPNVIINSSVKRGSPHIVNVTFAGKDNERMMMELDERGIMCAVGSACSASSDEPSHVLTAIGLNTAATQSTLRFSFGRDTDQTAIDTTIAALRELVAQ